MDRAWDFPGFGPLTRIETSFGDFPAQTLRERDSVRTQSGTLAQIRWVDRVTLNEDFLHHHPEAQPIVIPAHALGRGLPRHDVTLSPGQKIVAAGAMMPRREMTAAELLRTGKAIRKPETIVTYTFLLCAQPVHVRVEGLFAPLEPPRW